LVRVHNGITHSVSASSQRLTKRAINEKADKDGPRDYHNEDRVRNLNVEKVL
jgi:hypothetical protein